MRKTKIRLGCRFIFCRSCSNRWTISTCWQSPTADYRFNVLSGEFDDHTKNFSFRLKRGGAWELSPAYDLTGAIFPSEDPWSAQVGLHQLSVNGKRKDIDDEDLLIVADRFGIGTARRILDEVRNAVTPRE